MVTRPKVMAPAHIACAMPHEASTTRTSCRQTSGRIARSPQVARSFDDPLERRERLETHRAAPVQPAGGDADLGAEAQLPAVVQPRARVDDDACGVDFAPPALGVRVVAGADGLRVTGAEARDVGE